MFSRREIGKTLVNRTQVRFDTCFVLVRVFREYDDPRSSLWYIREENYSSLLIFLVWSQLCIECYWFVCVETLLIMCVFRELASLPKVWRIESSKCLWPIFRLTWKPKGNLFSNWLILCLIYDVMINTARFDTYVKRIIVPFWYFLSDIFNFRVYTFSFCFRMWIFSFFYFRSFRKFRLIAEDVQGREVLTNFHGMDLTTDKLRLTSN